MLYVIVAVLDETGVSHKNLVQNSLSTVQGKYKIFYRGCIESPKYLILERISFFVKDNFSQCIASYSSYNNNQPKLKELVFSIVKKEQLEKICVQILNSQNIDEISSLVDFLLNDLVNLGKP